MGDRVSLTSFIHGIEKIKILKSCTSDGDKVNIIAESETGETMFDHVYFSFDSIELIMIVEDKPDE